MEGGLAAVSLDYGSAIDDMIKVSVGKQQQLDRLAGESGISALRRSKRIPPSGAW